VIAGGVEIEVGGERVVLMPQRAVYVARERTLLVADVHLGKVDAARAEGAPVSGGVTAAVLEDELVRLAEAVRVSGAARVIVLGDLLHAPAGMSKGMVEGVERWRAGLEVEIAVVTGNHDRKIEKVAGAWRMELLGERAKLAGFELVHDPAEMSGEGFAWCGHLHPAVRLAAGGDAMRLPAFWVRREVGILPAFTRVAAGKMPEWKSGDRVFAVAGDEVVEMPRMRRKGEHV